VTGQRVADRKVTNLLKSLALSSNARQRDRITHDAASLDTTNGASSSRSDCGQLRGKVHPSRNINGSVKRSKHVIQPPSIPITAIRKITPGNS
jgi:hypothetical protein